MVYLGTLPGSTTAFAEDVSEDGAVISGYCYISGRYAAWRWTMPTGMVDLGTLPGWTSSSAWSMSADGSTIGGQVSTTTTGHAMIWSQNLGMVDLNDYLPTLGVDLTGWSLEVTYSMSRDARTLVGAGKHNGISEGWMVTLGPRCYANCDGSTVGPVLNVIDFVCFLNKFAAADTYANCDGSTIPPVLNVLDFTCFLNQFAAGCS